MISNYIILEFCLNEDKIFLLVLQRCLTGVLDWKKPTTHFCISLLTKGTSSLPVPLMGGGSGEWLRVFVPSFALFSCGSMAVILNTLPSCHLLLIHDLPSDWITLYLEQ